MMRYSIGFPIAGPHADARSLAELARIAEDSGWDGVFLEDYIVHWSSPGKAPVCDPWIALAAIAIATRRVRIGTTVTPLSRRRPWKVAREAASLDHLSGGRMILGVGAGDLNDPGFRSVGEVTATATRDEMLDEALEIVTGLWSGKPFRFTGRHYNIDEMTFLPPPIQQPRIPIWVGGAWPHRRPVKRAARWDGACIYRIYPDGSSGALSAAELKEVSALIVSNRSVTTPFDLIVGGYERGDDLEKVRDQIAMAAEGGATWWAEYAVGTPEAIRKMVQAGPIRVD
jgi:hypothetical protein